MGGIGDTFSSLTIIYVFAGAFTLYQVVKSWRGFWTGALTAHNRQLSGGVAFFLLVPIGVLLHEFGHMLAAWSAPKPGAGAALLYLLGICGIHPVVE